MGIRLRRPDSAYLEQLLTQSRNDDLTYRSVGMAASDDSPPPGFRRDEWTREIGEGPADFDRARSAVANWEMHRGAGLLVLGQDPAQPGATVAMAAPLPIGYVDVVCRVVDVVDEPQRSGFSYGTMPNHPESGEETFMVRLDDEDRVWIDITAVWRPRDPLSRFAPPITRWLQRRATERYLDAIQSIIGEA